MFLARSSVVQRQAVHGCKTTCRHSAGIRLPHEGCPDVIGCNEFGNGGGGGKGSFMCLRYGHALNIWAATAGNDPTAQKYSMESAQNSCSNAPARSPHVISARCFVGGLIYYPDEPYTSHRESTCRFRLKMVSARRDSLTQNRQKNTPFVLHDSGLCTKLRHGIFHAVAVLFFSKQIGFWGEPRSRNVRKKGIHLLYRRA